MPGRIRSVLLKLEVRPAGRKSRCAHDRRHEIVKGEPRFVVKERGPAAAERGYCRECATVMLQRARDELERTARALGVDS